MQRMTRRKAGLASSKNSDKTRIFADNMFVEDFLLRRHPGKSLLVICSRTKYSTDDGPCRISTLQAYCNSIAG
jgi:hypothetical protein